MSPLSPGTWSVLTGGPDSRLWELFQRNSAWGSVGAEGNWLPTHGRETHCWTGDCFAVPPSHSLEWFVNPISKYFPTWTNLCYVLIMCSKQSDSLIEHWLQFVYIAVIAWFYLASTLGPATVWLSLINLGVCVRWYQGLSFVWLLNCWILVASFSVITLLYQSRTSG